ncbi:MAG TPA: oxygenase MpaB family protein [Actinomycetota bacterium]|nr:oxygenase MpaB family protein [Actinomycetota bacterium]
MAVTATRHAASREPSVELPGAWQALSDAIRIVRSAISTTSSEDPGLFGPGSVAWRIHRDPAFGVGGIAALFHEALHPVAMAAVDQHSDFSHNAWVRLWSTTEWLFTVIFGSTAAAEAAGERVRRLHERIRGIDPVTGRQYRADDPDLLLWIHAVSVDYALRSYQAYAYPLSPDDADRFVREMKVQARLVALAEEAAPSSVTELRAYLTSMRPQWRMTDSAYGFFRAFSQARMPLSMRPVWLLHLVGIVALLPPEVRRLYDAPRWIPTGPLTRQVVRLSFRLLNLGYPALKSIRTIRRRLDALERAAIRSGRS